MMLIVPGSRIRGVGVLLVAYEVKHWAEYFKLLWLSAESQSTREVSVLLTEAARRG